MSAEPDAPRILVADDDAIGLGLISDILRGYGARVTVVPDGQAAVAHAMMEAFDLIILDIEMPILDGIQACRQLRDLAFTRNVPVLMLTGRTDQESVDNAFNAGAGDYLTKPVHAALLWRRVCNLLELNELKKKCEELETSLQIASDSQS